MVAAGRVELLVLIVVFGTPVVLILLAARRRRSGPGTRSREDVLSWLLALAASAGACVLALITGIGLGLFGLGAVALIVSIGLVAFAALAWQRGAMPLALVAASLAGGATLATATPPRIDRSSGMLVAAPATAADADGRRFVRGLGSVLVDLRKTTLPSGSITRISARSDSGRVVVALPEGRCVNLRVRARRPWRDTSEAVQLVESIAHRNGTLPDREREPASANLGAFDKPTRARMLWGSQYERMPVMVAYGRTVLAGRSGIAHWRRAVAPDAPTVELDLQADNITVRDYPPGTTALGRRVTRQERESGAPPEVYPALRGADWPGERYPAPSLIPPTGEEAPYAAVPPTGAWLPAAIAGAREAARLAAGSCAGRAQRAASWMTFSDERGRLIRVNGLGTVVRGGREIRVNGIGTVTVVRP